MFNKNIRSCMWQWLLILTLLFTFNLSVQAAVPDNVDYQGYLTDTGGSPVSGTVSVTFSLYNIDTGGIALWTDTQSVDVTNGLFNTKLGRVGNPFPIGLFDTPLYIGIDVAGDGEMAPRIAMSSSGFAHKANDADTVGGVSVGSLATASDLATHSGDTANPHGVTAAQTGAASSASFSFHSGDASAHHAKTTSFAELADTATDAQIPDTITINQAANANTLDGLDSTAFMSSSTDDWVNITGDTMTGQFHVLNRVGIGTTVPAYTLDVQVNTPGIAAKIVSDNNTVSTGSAVALHAYGDAYDTINGRGTGAYFYASGGSTSGNATGSYHDAQAYGNARAIGVYSDATIGSTTGREYAFYGYGDSFISGLTGLGTQSPQSRLSVFGGATIGSTYVSSAQPDGNLAVASRVGIGTTAPAYTLDVQVNTPGIAAMIVSDNNTVSTGSAVGLHAYGDAYDTNNGRGTGAYFYASGGSTSGNATGSYHDAQAYGTSRAIGVLSDATLGTTTGREYAFYGYGDGYFSGRLGIGTTLPNKKLSIVDSQNTTIAEIRNTSTTISADGLRIQIGPTLNPDTNTDFVQFYDGDGTFLGEINGNGLGGINYSTASDGRLKTNIRNFTGGLDIVERMQVRQYEFKKAAGNTDVGFVAQELQSVLPYVVSGEPDGDLDKEPMGVDYGRITPVLVSAIQEQAATIKLLIAKNRELEARLVKVESNQGN